MSDCVSYLSTVKSRINDILMQIPYLIEIFAELSIKVASEHRKQAETVLTTLRLLSAVAQGSLVVDSSSVKAQRERLPEGAKVPKLFIGGASLGVEEESDIQCQDWVTLRLKLIRQHVNVGSKAPLACTVYDSRDKSYEYRKEILWVILQDAQSHQLYGAWKIDDLSQEVDDALGFWAPSAPGNFIYIYTLFFTKLIFSYKFSGI